MLRSTCARIVLAGVVAGVSAPALGQSEVITFSFSDLAASFVNGATMQDRVFSAEAVALPGGLRTGGDVTRVDVSPSQTADFPTGFSGLGPAHLSVSMNLATVVQNQGGIDSIAATGSFAITDADGDVITGTLNGSWRNIGGGFEVFEGLITSASIVPQADGDDANFNGPGGGAFSYAGLQMAGLTGAFVQLQLTVGTFFDQDFAGVSSQVSGVLVPAPAGAGVLALAGLAAARRRRR